MGYKRNSKELEIDHTTVRQWVKHYRAGGLQGLEEKRDKAKGSGIGRPRIGPKILK